MSATPVAKVKDNSDAVPARPCAAPVTTKEITEMLIYEELARARIQELRDGARLHRIRSHARAARRRKRAASLLARRE